MTPTCQSPTETRPAPARAAQSHRATQRPTLWQRAWEAAGRGDFVHVGFDREGREIVRYDKFGTPTYEIHMSDTDPSCTCEDARRHESETGYRCKHGFGCLIERGLAYPCTAEGCVGVVVGRVETVAAAEGRRFETFRVVWECGSCGQGEPR